jgi:hypothetical protein
MQLTVSLHTFIRKACFIKYDDPHSQILETSKPGGGLEKGMVAYWYSYDRDNLVLKYGKGYT